MMNNKKGLSTVVTTLIIILLVFIAVGIIWVVIRNVITTGTENVNYQAMCLEVSVKSNDLNCAGTSPDNCTVLIYRDAGGDSIDGVKLVFSDGTSTEVKDVPGDITPLATETSGAQIMTSLPGVVTSVEVVPYFTDGQGVQHICQ